MLNQTGKNKKMKWLYASIAVGLVLIFSAVAFSTSDHVKEAIKENELPTFEDFDNDSYSVIDVYRDGKLLVVDLDTESELDGSEVISDTEKFLERYEEIERIETGEAGEFLAVQYHLFHDTSDYEEVVESSYMKMGNLYERILVELGEEVTAKSEKVMSVNEEEASLDAVDYVIMNAEKKENGAIVHIVTNGKEEEIQKFIPEMMEAVETLNPDLNNVSLYLYETEDNYIEGKQSWVYEDDMLIAIVDHTETHPIYDMEEDAEEDTEDTIEE